MKSALSRVVAFAALTSASVVFGAVSPAHANTYDWNYTGTTVDNVPPNNVQEPVVGSGTLTTNATNDLVIGFTGNWSSPPDTTGLPSTTVALDAPDVSSGNQLGNDNVISPGTPIFLTDNGLGFVVGSSLHVDIYYLAPAGEPAGYYTDDCFGTNCAGGFGNNDFGTFTLSQASATPLPSTWTMLIAGFAGFGFLAYRGTKKGSAALAAA